LTTFFTAFFAVFFAIAFTGFFAADFGLADDLDFAAGFLGDFFCFLAIGRTPVRARDVRSIPECAQHPAPHAGPQRAMHSTTRLTCPLLSEGAPVSIRLDRCKPNHVYQNVAKHPDNGCRARLTCARAA
jgi:hypothetical protein